MKKSWCLPLVLFSLAFSFQTLLADQSNQVISIGADTITVQTRSKAGLKVTHIDEEGTRTTDAPNNIETYHILPTTEITVDGLPSKLSDIHPGMKVEVTSDTTPTNASIIVANTVPPLAAAAPLINGKPASRQMFQKITRQKVLAIQPDRITVAEDGAAKATAYLITPSTTITVNGQSASAAAIQVGMPVRVNAADQTTAASIQAGDTGH